MHHQAFRLGFAGELLQGADVVHTNIVRFLTAKLADTGFQPVCQGISSVIADIPGKGVLHIVVALVMYTESVMIELTLLRPGFCAVRNPEHTAAHILFLDFTYGGAVFPSVGFQHTVAHHIVEFAQYADVLRDTIEVVQAANFRIVLPDDFNIRAVEQLVPVHGPPKVSAPVFIPFDLHDPKFVQFVLPLFVGDVEKHLSIPRTLQRTFFVSLNALIPDDPDVVAQIAYRLAGMGDLGLFLGEREMQLFGQELPQIL